MTITLDLNSKARDQLASQARAQGLPVEVYVRKLVERAIESDVKPWDLFGDGARTPQEAGHDIAELRRDFTLGGLKITDLIHEGRHY